jgi:hypothetical protein
VVVVRGKCNGDGARSQHDLLITRLFACRDLAVLRQCVEAPPKQGERFVAKRKKGAKVQKRGKLRRGNSAKRGKPRKVAKAAVAKAKPKRAPVKKAARKVKQPVAQLVVEIEQPTPGAITVTEVEEVAVRKAS